MNKEAAHNMWSQIIKLTTRGHASELLRNPAMDFITAVKSGVFDQVSDEEYADLLNGCNQMAYAIWNDAPQRSAGDLLISALEETQISDDRIDAITDQLAASSDCTEYPTAETALECEPPPTDTHKTRHTAGAAMDN